MCTLFRQLTRRGARIADAEMKVGAQGHQSFPPFKLTLWVLSWSAVRLSSDWHGTIDIPIYLKNIIIINIIIINIIINISSSSITNTYIINIYNYIQI